MRKLIIMFICMLFTFSCIAQEEDEKGDKAEKEFQTLDKDMNKLYNEGKLEDLINLFNLKCLKKNGSESFKFKRTDQETKADIYNLVSLALIATDRPDSASKYLKKLYVIKHAKDFSEEWISIRKDREKYDVLPDLLIGLNYGMVYSSAIPTKTNNVFENIETNPSKYSQRNAEYEKNYDNLLKQYSYSYGLSLDYRILKSLLISCNPTFVTTKFGISTNNSWGTSALTLIDTVYSVSYQVNHQYTLNYFELPIDVKYIYSKYKFKPFIGAGYSYSFLTSGEIAENSLKYIQDNNEQTLTYKGSQSVQAIDYFQSYHALRGVLGLTYSPGREFDLTLRAIYKRNFSPVVNIKNAYSSASLVWSSYYAMDDMNFQSLTFELSFQFHLTYKAFKR